MVFILTVQVGNRAVLHGAPAVAKIGLVVVWSWGSVRQPSGRRTDPRPKYRASLVAHSTIVEVNCLKSLCMSYSNSDFFSLK